MQFSGKCPTCGKPLKIWGRAGDKFSIDRGNDEENWVETHTCDGSNIMACYDCGEFKLTDDLNNSWGK